MSLMSKVQFLCLCRHSLVVEAFPRNREEGSGLAQSVSMQTSQPVSWYWKQQQQQQQKEEEEEEEKGKKSPVPFSPNTGRMA